MKGISKSFGAVQANDGIDLEVRQGETLGLLGENGAGKSTLMNILYGLVHPDSGTLEVNGKEVVMSSSAVALSHGIGMVHQHFMLIPEFTVLENLILGAEPIRNGLLDRSKAQRTVIELAEKFGLQIDPNELVANLGVAARQRVEILRALYRGAKILILDEPTAMLSPKEADALFGVLREMADAGMSLILISHKLRDLMTFTDRITIIRDGRVVGSVLTNETSPQELATLMVGRETSLTLDVPMHERLEEPLLRVCDMKVDHAKLRMVSFDVHGGEIVGIAGVDGSGQIELLEAIVGLRPVTSGTVSIAGKNVTHLSPYSRLEHGLGYVPEDRTTEGLVGTLSIMENSILRRQRRKAWRRFGFLSQRLLLTHASQLIRDNNVRPPNPQLNVRALSGGNQQKLLIGRELADSPQILVVSQPTRGVDIAAARAIERRLVDARSKNRAVLVVSLDLDEIKSLCDRVLVLFRGEIVGELPRSEVTDDALGLLMTGVQT
ncbi:MAG: ABC transporter ATP-binding protein [Candidatus Nanopelagicaceae bacterium]|nr:ABC transporter ATP-binding protein [Candidatus Nanopelagicaceae bacterium]